MIRVPDRPYRLALLAGVALVVPLGLASKWYHGPGHAWCNDYGGAVLYEVLWILVVMLVRPHASPARAAAGVLVATSLLETLQLWHPPFLQAIRRTFAGATLLGTTFVWWDFPHYVVGSALGWAWVRWLRAKTQQFALTSRQ